MKQNNHWEYKNGDIEQQIWDTIIGSLLDTRYLDLK